MVSMTLYLKTFFALLFGIGLLFILALLNTDLFGPVYVFWFAGPLIILDSLGMPVIGYRDLTSYTTPIGYIALGIFYAMFIYVLAFVWLKVFTKARGI